MCGCESHWKRSADCTCRCPEHAWRRRPYEPKHRADVEVDACRYDEDPAPCETCAEIDRITTRVHRAEGSA